MKHLMNTLSGKFLCEVKKPTVTKNTTDVGKLLGTPEPYCEVCKKYLEEYEGLKK